MVRKRATGKRVNAVVEPATESDSDGIPSSRKKPRLQETSNESSSHGTRRQPIRLNYDVLFLIAIHVHPLDLLNLARTSRSFQELLTNKCAAFVWKKSREKIKDLPDCPAGLSEHEYARLMFCGCCYGCGTRTPTILWNIHRRYCLDCRKTRLLKRSSCHEVIRDNDVLAEECIKTRNKLIVYVDKEQVDAFMHEYYQSSNKEQFLSNKRAEYHRPDQSNAMRIWKRRLALERHDKLNMQHQQQEREILERLKQHGYERELAYFGSRVQKTIKTYFVPYFKSARHLTEKAWSRMQPKVLETMDSLRRERLAVTVYRPRRELLASHYTIYIDLAKHKSMEYDYLPDKWEVSRCPQLQEIVTAPEEVQISAETFVSALAKFPEIIDEWKKMVDTDLAGLVKIPSRLSFRDSSGSATSSKAARDKLHLACAVFATQTIHPFPDVLFQPRLPRDGFWGKNDRPSFHDRYVISFLADAPYIVHACGLDPHVATQEDMDRQNARIKCMSCKPTRARNWRDAMMHAFLHHSRPIKQQSSVASRWKRISDEHIDAIEAAERCVEATVQTRHFRCLWCPATMGNARGEYSNTDHIRSYHSVDVDDIREGVHYVRLRTYHQCSVEMVKKKESVTFRP